MKHRRALPFGIVVVLIRGATVSADPGPGEEATRSAASAALATSAAEPRPPGDSSDVGDEDLDADRVPSRPAVALRWSDGPRRVPTPRGASMRRARDLGLGTRECASALFHAAPDARWVRAARGRTPSRLLWPVDEGRWVRGFGFVRTSRPELIHRGIDIAAPIGATVRAAADGIVAYSDNGVRGYGNLVMIVHPNGWVTLYAHNARTTVQPGYRVRRGERIALVGSTGIARGPHVHFELWREGRPVDPSALFDGGPRFVERLGERAARRGLVPPPRPVPPADRPFEAPLDPHPEDRAHAGAFVSRSHDRTPMDEPSRDRRRRMSRSATESTQRPGRDTTQR